MSRELIERFYEGFKKRDAEVMAACYADDVAFSDPVYVDLHGERARDMWRMLAGRAKDLDLTYEIKSASDTRSTSTRTSSTFGHGRDKRSARPVCCSAGLLC